MWRARAVSAASEDGLRKAGKPGVCRAFFFGRKLAESVLGLTLRAGETARRFISCFATVTAIRLFRMIAGGCSYGFSAIGGRAF
jgi:hypothetical protein